MHRGYVKAWRAMADHPIWKLGTPEQKAIVMALLWLANYKERSWVWKGQKFTVKPGQMITSLESIAKKAGAGVTIQNVRTALVKFRKLDFLTDESTKQGRLITITNWSLYQSDEPNTNNGANSHLTDDQQTANRQPNTYEEDKNVKELKNVKEEDKIKSCVDIGEAPMSTPPQTPDPPSSVTKPKRKEPTGEHSQTIRYFTDAFEAKNGIKYPYHAGKDSSAMKNLLAHYPPEVVRQMIDLYLADQNPYFTKVGKTIAMLWSNAATFAVKAGSKSERGGRAGFDYNTACAPTAQEEP